MMGDNLVVDYQLHSSSTRMNNGSCGESTPHQNETGQGERIPLVLARFIIMEWSVRHRQVTTVIDITFYIV